MPTATQDNRVGQIKTALGKDKLLLETFVATERLSTPFEIVVDVLTEDLIDFIPHLGSGVSLEVDGADQVARAFHGFLYEAEAKGIAETYQRYQLRLRPWFYLLTHGRNIRMFQKKTAKAIIQAVFNENGYTTNFDVGGLSSAGTIEREYCVQFRESDFDFVSRLMEEEGIYYYFEHTANAHKMILCESISAHNAFAGGAVKVTRGDGDGVDENHFTDWNKKVRPSIFKATLRDSHFRAPGAPIEQMDDAEGKTTAEQKEFYDYPARYGYLTDDGKSGAGKAYAEALLAAKRVERETFFGRGPAFAVPTGARLKVKDPATGEAEFLVVATRHTFGPQTYLANQTEAEGEAQVEVEAIPVATVWKPLPLTPRPTAAGPQTATVVGSVDEGPDVDDLGRVHVKFEWDRDTKKDRSSSCWIRVAQGWADGGFGQMNIPRVGEEVIVDFLDGDPDRPIVTGRVYNTGKMPPYKLPDEQTKSTWKSRTVGASGSYEGAETEPSGPGYNELRFEDKGGSEEVFIHAQRDYKRWVQLDESRKTERDVAVRVGRNQETAVKNNETFTVEEGDEARTIAKGSRKTVIKKDDALTLNSGDFTLKVEQGSVTIEAMKTITLKVGQNTFEISQQGVKLKGMMVEFKADTTMKAEGLMSEVTGSAMTTIKGGMVKIN